MSAFSLAVRIPTENWRRITGGVVAGLRGSRWCRLGSLVVATREPILRGSVCDLLTKLLLPLLLITINFWPEAANRRIAFKLTEFV